MGLIHLIVSVGYWVATSLRGLFRRAIGREALQVCTVLYYHRVPEESRARFGRQMDMLLQYAKPIAADRTEPLARGLRYAAVTFDDGYSNVLENALPELIKRKIPSTIFVVTGALGQFPHWLTDPADPARNDTLASGEQLQNVPPNLVTIGSHTVNHRSLPSLNNEDARRELEGSRAGLEALLKRPVTLFSFPFGEFNSKVLDWCREAGYRRVFTILPRPAFADPNEFVTGRVSVEPTDWPLEFRLKLWGAYSWQPVAFALKRRLFSHVRSLSGRGRGVGGHETCDSESVSKKQQSKEVRVESTHVSN